MTADPKTGAFELPIDARIKTSDSDGVAEMVDELDKVLELPQIVALHDEANLGCRAVAGIVEVIEADARILIV